MAGDVDDLLEADATWKQLRPLVDPTVPGSLPFKVYAGVDMSEQSTLWRSAKLKAFVGKGLEAQVAGLPDGITFGALVTEIHAAGFNAYVYGGFVRDAFTDLATVPDDVDMLFTIPVLKLRDLCTAKGWPSHVKVDEKTGQPRTDFIAIGDNDAKRKFSGHTLDAMCAGEFRMNCLMYDTKHDVMIDSCGRGISDAVQRRLCIPWKRASWDKWAENCDRLPGMVSMRFINFRGRGYGADADTTKYLVARLLDLLKTTTAATEQTLGIFKKRKLKTPEKRARFIASLRKEFATAGADADAFVAKYFA